MGGAGFALFGFVVVESATDAFVAVEKCAALLAVVDASCAGF